MSDERKRGSVGFWATAILLLLPVLYVASFGPACWIAIRFPSAARRVVQCVYQPLLRVTYREDGQGGLLYRFAGFGRAKYSDLRIYPERSGRYTLVIVDQQTNVWKDDDD